MANVEAPTTIEFGDVYSATNNLFSAIAKKFSENPERIELSVLEPFIEILPMSHRNDSFNQKYTLIRKLITPSEKDSQYVYGLLVVHPDTRRFFIAERDSILRVRTDKTSRKGVIVPEAVENRLAKMVNQSGLQKKRDYSLPEQSFAA